MGIGSNRPGTFAMATLTAFAFTLATASAQSKIT